MNKKGFTLAEVVGVIIILALIGLLAFPPILNMIKNSEQKIDEATKTLIYTASSQYTTKYTKPPQRLLWGGFLRFLKKQRNDRLPYIWGKHVLFHRKTYSI